MKKSNDGKQNAKPRRLTLSRETIKTLDDPALLKLALGELEQNVARTSMTETMC